MRVIGINIMGALALGACQSGEQEAPAETTQTSAMAMKQYEAADAQGEVGQKCVKAREARDAFLREKSEADHLIWTAVAEADCQAVGLPA